MRTIEIITNSAEETKRMGAALAVTLGEASVMAGQALVVAFEGDLGTGKTTFIQGFAKGLKIKESVLSPTFVIQKDFKLNYSAKGGPAVGWKNFYHIDAYRLKNPEELLELGFEDIIKNPENIVAIEWADKTKTILPRKILKIKIENLEGNKRKLAINFKV